MLRLLRTLTEVANTAVFVASDQSLGRYRNDGESFVRRCRGLMPLRSDVGRHMVCDGTGPGTNCRLRVRFIALLRPSLSVDFKLKYLATSKDQRLLTDC